MRLEIRRRVRSSGSSPGLSVRSLDQPLTLALALAACQGQAGGSASLGFNYSPDSRHRLPSGGRDKGHSKCRAEAFRL